MEPGDIPGLHVLPMNFSRTSCSFLTGMWSDLCGIWDRGPSTDCQCSLYAALSSLSPILSALTVLIFLDSHLCSSLHDSNWASHKLCFRKSWPKNSLNLASWDNIGIHLFVSYIQNSLSFIIWYPVSWKPLFHIFCLLCFLFVSFWLLTAGRINLDPATPSGPYSFR